MQYMPGDFFGEMEFLGKKADQEDLLLTCDRVAQKL